jgi:hypothetical protein
MLATLQVEPSSSPSYLSKYIIVALAGIPPQPMSWLKAVALISMLAPSVPTKQHATT